MRKAFVIMMSLAAMLVASMGLKAQEIVITLEPGWNWISYPNAEAMDIASALGDFEPMEGDVIKSHYSNSTYSRGRWSGGVTHFIPGKGYKYYSTRTDDVEFVFAQAASSNVATATPTGITATSAVVGGMVILPEGSHVFLRGVCWGTSSSPDIDGDHTTEGTGIGSFSGTLEGLNPNTTYYVRAYAVTDHGLAYGNEVSFSTIPIWTIEATPNPTEGGTITGVGDYEQNAICNLTAIANEGYIFANWTENGEVVSTDATYTFTVDAARTLVANFDLDHTYVDLGLPSGTLWATCNLGANLPEEYGYYFAWGETQPKDNFSWTNYQYCMGSFNTLTKYCNNPDIGYNGFTDNLTTLEPSDDAATANWGDDWRMPTEEEWQELCQNTTVTWTTRNGVRGRLFTASNGNSLFLPASGYCNESTPEATGIIGDYWTSSLDTDYPSGALSFFFNSSNYYISFCNRLYGRNVRAVYSEPQNTSYSIDATANPAEGGEVSGIGTYQQGDECTLTATANEGYTFTNWTENGNVVSTTANYTFMVNGNHTLVANFTVTTSNLIINSDFETDGGYTSQYQRTYGDNVVEAGHYAIDNTTANHGGGIGWPTLSGSTGRFMLVNGLGGNSNPTTVVWTTQQPISVVTNTYYTFSCRVVNLNMVVQGQINPAKLQLKINGNPIGTVNQLPTNNDWHTWTVQWYSGIADQAVIQIVDMYTGNSGLGDDFALDNLSFRVQQNNAPTGAINGKFTINADGDQVYFSQGNLQYQASTNTWRFAENQWDYVGDETQGTVYDNNVKSNNSLISPTYNGWIDLFGWGTSGYNHGAASYQPWSTSTNSHDYYAYGNNQYNLYDQTGQADWGYNYISNGGNTVNQWRTLTQSEMSFIMFNRSTSSGVRYAKANVNGINGLILLPDYWDANTFSLLGINDNSASYNNNILSISQWESLEQSGAIFLPASGVREELGTSVNYSGLFGYYWLSTYCSDWNNNSAARCMIFTSGEVHNAYPEWRQFGTSVRLVQDYNP